MPRPLSQLGLQAFRLTILTGSASAAALTVSRSQPAVSRILKDLEQDVGFRLFDRLKGRLVPTTEGLLLFEEVQRSFAGLDQIAAVASDIRKGRRGSLSIAAMPALAVTVLANVMTRFAADHRDTKLLFQEAASNAVVQMVLARECQLGFTSLVAVTLGLQSERRYRAGGMCIMPPGHRLARRSAIRVDDLDGEKLITLSLSTRLGSQIAVALEQAESRHVLQIETHLCTLAAALVQEGAGLAIVDSITAVSHVKHGGVAVPFEAPVAMEFGVVCPEGAAISTVQADFIEAADATLMAIPGVSRLPSGTRLKDPAA